MVHLEGFEPSMPDLRGRCLEPLSYKCESLMGATHWFLAERDMVAIRRIELLF